MLFSMIYPEMKNFNKIRKVFENVGNLDAVKNYETSSRAIKECCPNKYFKDFSEEYKKSNQCRSESSKSSCFSISMCEKKNNQGAGFCKYEKKDESMDIE